jgi:hypothetical protein
MYIYALKSPMGSRDSSRIFSGNLYFLYFSKIYVSSQIFEYYIIIIGATVPALGTVHNRHMTWWLEH